MRLSFMKRIVFFYLLLFPLLVFAQNEGNMSMYWAVPTQFNSATAGIDTLLRFTAYDRMQWVGSEYAPKSVYVSVDMPFKSGGKKHGIGAALHNYTEGAYKSSLLSGQYSYKLKLKRKSSISFGAQLGRYNMSFDASKITLPDSADVKPGEVQLGEVKGTAFDVGLGVYFQKMIEKRELYIGLSAIHLNEANLDVGDYASAKQKRTFFFLAGGNIPMSRTLYIIQPSLLVKSTIQNTTFDLTLRATYDHRFWGGASYRYNDAVVLMFGADIQHFRIGYSYDIGISGLARNSKGSHEILGTYFMKLDVGKKKLHPKKSIRIL